MIQQEVIEQVRQASDIAQIIGEFVRLKKKGKTFEGLCPFHTEKTPSFKVNPDRQIYHCFGCGKGGSVITFLMEHEKFSFLDAVRYLALKANITIRESAGTDLQREQLEKIAFANQIALEYFQKVLREPRYSTVLDGYLTRKRNISEESIQLFNLGLSDDSWDGLCQYATKKGLTLDDLVKAGLAIYSESNRKYFDRFRQRLMIPIFNLSQKPIAFGGRTLKKGESAKYVNSPETPVYSKGNILYGLNFSRDHIRESASAIIVEGYFDLISLWQTGVKNVVASSGTAFTAQQARLLARFCESVYLFFDADSAGQNAALHSVEYLYDAGLEVQIIQTPQGEDPDTIARKFGLDAVERLKTEAIGYIPFHIRRVKLESSAIIAKEKLVKELGALGWKIGDPTRRSLFLDEAATQLRIDASLFQNVPAPKEQASRSVAVHNIQQQKFEMEFLSLLFCNPGAIDIAFETVAPDDLDSKQLSRLYSAMIQQYRTRGLVDASTLVEDLADESSISLLTELASRSWPTEKIEEETRRYLENIKERRKKRIRKNLQEELAQAEAAGDQKRASALLEQLRSFGL